MARPRCTGSEPRSGHNRLVVSQLGHPPNPCCLWLSLLRLQAAHIASAVSSFCVSVCASLKKIECVRTPSIRDFTSAHMCTNRACRSLPWHAVKKTTPRDIGGFGNVNVRGKKSLLSRSATGFERRVGKEVCNNACHHGDAAYSMMVEETLMTAIRPAEAQDESG